MNLRFFFTMLAFALSSQALALPGIIATTTCIFQKEPSVCRGSLLPQYLNLALNADSFAYYLDRQACHNKEDSWGRGTLTVMVDTTDELVMSLQIDSVMTNKNGGFWNPSSHTLQLRIDKSTMQGAVEGFIYTDVASYSLTLPVSCMKTSSAPITFKLI